MLLRGANDTIHLNMRKLLLPSLLLTVFLAHSRQVSPDEASAVASDFFHTSGIQSTLSDNPMKLKRVVDSSGANPYYVFNATDGNGFVIVSGDDRAPRILGYSTQGEFEGANMPPQLNALLTSYSERLDNLPDMPHASWSNVLSRSQENEVLLPTANWGQGYPYNTDCPVIDGESTLTGCVATAMAIVMKYHNWPESYDWAAMPMNTEEDPINFENGNDIPALAKIMRDAGEAVFMNYGVEESGAYLDWIGHRLQSVFHYSPDCQYIGGDHFDKGEWELMLKGNLDKGNPVIYDGYGSGGHHAFVLDGYNSSNMYHVNWGWNGMDNGYYALDVLEPMEGWGFSEYNGMIMNIEPDHNLSDYSECFTDYGYLWAVGANRQAAVMNVSVENVKKGEPFHLFNSALTVTPGFKGQIGVAVVDSDNNIKEVLRTVYCTTFDPGTDTASPQCVTMRFYNLIPTCDIAPTDRLQFVSKHDNDDNYKFILGTMEWPSSKSVTGNKPELSTVVFNIAEGAKCSYIIEESDLPYMELPTGITEVPTYVGASFSIFPQKENPDSENPLHLAIHGNLFGGNDEYWTGHDPSGYPLMVYGEKYEVNLSMLDLKDEAVHLDEAGTLQDKLANVDGLNVGSLTISGKMNALDFWYIRDNCLSIQSLDLKDVEIEEVTAGDGKDVPDDMTHPANTIPYRALPGLVNLENLILPETLTAIEGFSLMSMKLTSISIPVGVKTIGRDAFWNNGNLQAVEVCNPEPPVFDYTPFDDTLCPANGVLFVPEGSVQLYKEAEIWQDFNKIIEGSMPNPLKTEITIDNLVYECYIDEAKVVGYVGEPVNVIIPETITSDGTTYYTVTAIKEECFNTCSTLESLEMPNSISEIGYYCFNSCENLESVKLSSNITNLPYGLFRYCSNLKEFEITPNIKYIGDGALYGTGISKMFIPKTFIPDPYSRPFGRNTNLENFEVEEGHEYYKEVDGILYRIAGDGLVLESVPGAKSGIISIIPECTELFRESFSGVHNVTDLILNEGLQTIDQYAVWGNDHLQHITIPAGVTIQEWAFFDNIELESVTFHGNPTTFSNIFAYCPFLKYIYVTAEEESVKLDGLFGDEYENLEFYNSSVDKKFEYSGAQTIFVPGACSDRYSGIDNTDIVEMWTYRINRNNNCIAISPNVEDIEIKEVTINGHVATPENNIYKIIDETAKGSETIDSESYPTTDLDVKVEYVLHGHQVMVTHYSPVFNATIPDSDVSGVEDLSIEKSEVIDVYGLDGSVVVKNGNPSALQKLIPGVYVIRQGSKTMKVAVGK